MGKDKQKLTPEERAAKRAELKARIKAMDKKNSTKWQAVKYFFCTASAGLIQIISFTILQAVIPEFGTMHFLVEDMSKATFTATTVALGLSILWNFTLNRKFTFKSAKNVPLAMALAFLFYVPFYPFQTWYVHTIKVALGNTDAAGFLAEATVMLINGILEFCWQKFVIYRKSTNTAVKAEDGAAEIAEDESEEKITKEDEITPDVPEIGHIKDDNVAIDDVEIGEDDIIKKD